MVTRETDLAVGELIQAAAHQHGVVGPVPFTVSRPKYYEWCGLEDGTEIKEKAMNTTKEPRIFVAYKNAQNEITSISLNYALKSLKFSFPTTAEELLSERVILETNRAYFCSSRERLAAFLKSQSKEKKNA